MAIGRQKLNVILEFELKSNIMSRQRLHYTPNQITKALYTTGSEWQTEMGALYIGPYHTYTTGEVYSETEWNPQKSIKLLPFVTDSKAVSSYKQLKTITVQTQTPQSYMNNKKKMLRIQAVDVYWYNDINIGIKLNWI